MIVSFIIVALLLNLVRFQTMENVIEGKLEGAKITLDLLNDSILRISRHLHSSSTDTDESSVVEDIRAISEIAGALRIARGENIKLSTQLDTEKEEITKLRNQLNLAQAEGLGLKCHLKQADESLSLSEDFNNRQTIEIARLKDLIHPFETRLSGIRDRLIVESFPVLTAHRRKRTGPVVKESDCNTEDWMTCFCVELKIPCDCRQVIQLLSTQRERLINENDLLVRFVEEIQLQVFNTNRILFTLADLFRRFVVKCVHPIQQKITDLIYCISPSFAKAISVIEALKEEISDQDTFRESLLMELSELVSKERSLHIENRRIQKESFQQLEFLKEEISRVKKLLACKSRVFHQLIISKLSEKPEEIDEFGNQIVFKGEINNLIQSRKSPRSRSESPRPRWRI